MKARYWRWILYQGQTIYRAGFEADGTLRNPRNYPEEIVRTAIDRVVREDHERRSRAAQRAAVTRAKRQERLVYEIADKILRDDWKVEPGPNCIICGKALADLQSINRSIGSECWQHILACIQLRKNDTQCRITCR
jgi:hypothetical protein